MVSPRRTRKNSLQSSQSDQISELKLLIKESRDDVIRVLKEDMCNLKDKLESLTSRFSDLEASVLSVERNHDNLKSEISVVKTELDSAIVDANKLSLNEMDNRMSRMNNIVIRGLPEENGTITEREVKDKSIVSEVFNVLKVNTDMFEVRRLGKPNKNRPRLLRVSLSSICTKMEVLRKSKSLKHSRFQEIFIQPDLTPFQQAIEQSLRKELKERREKGENVVIYNSQVCLRSDLRDFRQ